MAPNHDLSAVPGEAARKTLAIRLEAEQHAQLTMIAQLEDLTVTDAIRQAIDGWIEERRNSSQLQERAQAVLDEIERDAASKRGALAALLGGAEEKTPASRRKAPMGFSPQGTARPKEGTSATS
jgi:hypothetical protein